MSLTLRPMSLADFPNWLTHSAAKYAADLVAAGSTSKDAKRQAQSSIKESFPGGCPSAEHAVFELLDNRTAVVGYLWVGRDRSDDPTAWWVWDIFVEPQYRGKGYGKAGMLLAEKYAASQGAASIGLNVFGFNSSARGLYESIGYHTTNVKMRKSLSPAALHTEAGVEYSDARTSSLIDLVWSGETELLSPEVRRNTARIEALLAPDFTEIGQSGVHWSREFIIEALVAEVPSAEPAIVNNRTAREVAPGVVLVSYQLKFAGRASLRSALWRLTGDSVQCFFHQGTPAAPAVAQT